MARGRWLKKMAAKAKDKLEDVKDKVISASGEDGSTGDLVGSLVSSAFSGDGMEAALSNMELGPAISSIQERGAECSKLAAETIELCETTQTKSQQMVDFGKEIQETLQSFGAGGMDASALETIRDLTDGAKLEEAVTIAKGLDTVAVGCIDKSVAMIDLMEDSMDELPDSLEKWIDQYAEQQEPEGEDADLSLESFDKDMKDVEACIEAMKDLNIATAFQIGLQAFEQLSSKAKRSQDMFISIKGFSTDLRDVTDDFSNLDVVSLSSKIKDILKCIRLSEVMRAVAEGTKKIIQVMINLFQATSSKISTLWAGLAFAKECMSDCVEHVMQAKTSILDAHGKSLSLLEKSESVLGQLKSAKSMNRETFKAVKDLSTGEEIPEAIALATGMDEMIVECVSKVNSMVDRVQEGFQNLPDIITDGFDIEAEGKDDTDPQPAGVEEDIAELEASREAIEGADIFKACQSGASGFSSVSKKTEVCTEMLVNVRDFSTNCNGTIESFLGVWDLESAMNKIKEMCRLVNLGELMKAFAQQIKDLVLAIIALLKAALEKFSSLELSDLGDQVDDLVGNAVGNVMGDEVGDMVGAKVDQAMDKITGKLGGLFGRR